MLIVFHAGYLHAEIDGLTAYQTAVCHDKRIIAAESLHELFSVHSRQESVLVVRINVFGKFSLTIAEKMPAASYLRERTVLSTSAVLREFLGVGIDVEHLGIIPCKRLSHMVVHETSFYSAVIRFSGHSLFVLIAHKIGDILTHTEDT